MGSGGGRLARRRTRVHLAYGFLGKPWAFTSPDFPVELKEAGEPPSIVSLEVFVRVSFPSDMHDAWKCVFPIHAFLPFRQPLDRWVGKELELKGRLIMRGERFSRRMGPMVQWEKEGEWIRGARKDRPKVAAIVFKGRLTCLPRVGAELLSLNMRWVPEEEQHVVALREELVEREYSQGWWGTDRRGRLSLPRDLRRESEILGLLEEGRERNEMEGVGVGKAYNANKTVSMLEDENVEVIGEDTESGGEVASLSGKRRKGSEETIGEEDGGEDIEEKNSGENEKEKRVEIGREDGEDEEEGEEESSAAEDDDDDEDFELGQRTMARRGKRWRTNWGTTDRGGLRGRERKSEKATGERKGRRGGSSAGTGRRSRRV